MILIDIFFETEIGVLNFAGSFETAQIPKIGEIVVLLKGDIDLESHDYSLRVETSVQRIEWQVSAPRGENNPDRFNPRSLRAQVIVSRGAVV